MPIPWRDDLPDGHSKTRVSYFRKTKLVPDEYSFKGFRRPPPFAVVAAVEYGGVVYWGISLCNEGDNFSRKIGKRMAEGRALKQMVMEEDVGIPIKNFIGMLRELRNIETFSILTKDDFKTILTSYKSEE